MWLVTFAFPIVPTNFPTHGQNPAGQSTVPDISGVWMVEKFQPALCPNGGAFAALADAKFKAVNPEKNDPKLGCLPDGVPGTMFVPAPMEILQLPGRVLIIHEGIQVAPPNLYEPAAP